MQAAKRELKEETGYRAKEWKKLAEFFPSPGFLAEKMTIYIVHGLTAGVQTPMEDERIGFRATSWSDQLGDADASQGDQGRQLGVVEGGLFGGGLQLDERRRRS